MTRALIIAVLCLLLGACGGGSGQTPVINKSPYRVIPAETTVLAGDSMYSIAWRFGLDYQKIARWNGLSKPYKVRPGQRLRLRAPGASDGLARPATVSASPEKPAAKPAAKPTVDPKPAPTTVITTTATPAAAPGKWNWPAVGQLVGKFSPSKGQNGIKIAGDPGSAIRATAAGQVVYAGEGLRGYGKLIIVKHSASYLSAYAHNRKILVAEGEQIQSDQQIAQMGNSGADRTMLHFEIRKDGQPVDPLKFLR